MIPARADQINDVVWPGAAAWCASCGHRATAVAIIHHGDPLNGIPARIRRDPCGCEDFDPIDRSFWIWAPVYPPEWT